MTFERCRPTMVLGPGVAAAAEGPEDTMEVEAWSNATGKIQKYLLRQRARELQGGRGER